MKDNRLTISINCSPSELFNFTLDPKNTPVWIDFIEQEETNEWPPKIGTIYTNRASGSERWQHYVLIELERSKYFTLQDPKGNYTVKYSFTPNGKDSTEFVYYESVKEGDLESPFSQSRLLKLKKVME